MHQTRFFSQTPMGELIAEELLTDETPKLLMKEKSITQKDPYFKRTLLAYEN